MTTLKEAIEVIRSIEIEKSNLKTDIADELLGKYKGIIPKEKTSTEFIKELRGTLYGKI
ncbi:MAG: hypothetical protein KKC11_05915 [Candidatus Omnitrophica bacterium]|nr:hypothetical protein [Candidatus Omnitrophota bacterium]MBU0878813.1 hypothetical protein [Candidatus Omnitrophota bacterium]MBU1133815.1 hypothetical protein [Candidatus Omnitrophota bacterium]MBU1810239.1 hypothetical protein [Candidatus Omnitrophota bacterium]MBU2436625.1 hypothetical protein [Candidatus Omnitrophota bacterium]